MSQPMAGLGLLKSDQSAVRMGEGGSLEEPAQPGPPFKHTAPDRLEAESFLRLCVCTTALVIVLGRGGKGGGMRWHGTGNRGGGETGRDSRGKGNRGTGQDRMAGDVEQGT